MKHVGHILKHTIYILYLSDANGAIRTYKVMSEIMNNSSQEKAHICLQIILYPCMLIDIPYPSSAGTFLIDCSDVAQLLYN